jgi:RNA polymerase sigma-70 factor (ECF subfamily)
VQTTQRCKWPVSPEQDDPTLVAAAKSGCHQAFEALVCRYRERTLRIVTRFTRNREDAEDIVQQSLGKAFVHLRQFEGISSFSTWLTQIAINEALMWLRRKSAAREVSIEKPHTQDGIGPALDFLDPGRCPEDSCLRREWKRVLSQAIGELAPTLRTVIELRDIKELSTKQTAEALGLSVQTVKARVFRGRKKLQAKLRGYVRPARRRGKRPSEPGDEPKDDQFQVLT